MKKSALWIITAVSLLIFMGWDINGQATSNHMLAMLVSKKEKVKVNIEPTNPNSSKTTLPLKFKPENVQPLRNLGNQSLETRLINRLHRNSQFKKLISQKRLAVGLVDLSDINNIKYANVNGDEMMYAASLPKIAVLLSAVDALDKGELRETPEICSDMNRMICNSDNHATTRMIDRLGFKKIQDVMTDPRYNFFDENFGGGLWVGKRYAASGVRNPDPIKGLSHAATVTQVCRFYYMMAMGQLVNFERSKQMLDIMDDPALHHKFVHSLDQIAPDAKLFRKSGSWRNFHSDSVLVWGKDPNHRYILVGLAEDPQGESIMRELVKIAEDVLKVRA